MVFGESSAASRVFRQNSSAFAEQAPLTELKSVCFLHREIIYHIANRRAMVRRFAPAIFLYQNWEGWTKTGDEEAIAKRSGSYVSTGRSG